MDQEVRKLPEEASRGSLGSYGRRAHVGGRWDQATSPGALQSQPPWSQADEAGKVHEAQGHFTEQGDRLTLKLALERG